LTAIKPATKVPTRGLDYIEKFDVDQSKLEQPLTVAVASSLTELFAPSIHRHRIAGMLESYPFVTALLAYFKCRDAGCSGPSEAQRACTAAQACVAAIRFSATSVAAAGCAACAYVDRA
jgi:hypothetical protein